MGIREKLNENPGVTTGVTIAIIVLALAYIVWSLWPAGAGNVGTGEVWYTNDLGKTWEAGPYEDLYTLDASGKPKVQVYLFAWEEGGDPFVGWLQRMTPQAIQQMQKMQQAQNQDPAAAMMGMPPEMMMGGSQVRAPNGDKWYPVNSQPGMQIMQPPQKDGKTAVPVYPE